jgi:hypothetical protein
MLLEFVAFGMIAVAYLPYLLFLTAVMFRKKKQP